MYLFFCLSVDFWLTIDILKYRFRGGLPYFLAVWSVYGTLPVFVCFRAFVCVSTGFYYCLDGQSSWVVSSGLDTEINSMTVVALLSCRKVSRL